MLATFTFTFAHPKLALLHKELSQISNELNKSSLTLLDHPKMIWQVDSTPGNDTPHTLELETTPSRYPKRKREKITYNECDTDEYASSLSEDDHVPVKKVNLFVSLELSLMLTSYRSQRRANPQSHFQTAKSSHL